VAGDPSKPSKPASPRAAEESLNKALDDLERILEQQKDAPEPEAVEATPTKPGGQYDIPLLNDVIVPEDDAVEAPAEPYDPPTAPPGSPEYDEASRLLAARIASEIEVIVQSRIEAALEKATVEIRQQVKNHIEIMLPEILDEIIRDQELDGE
jgi:hypothetical protein